MKLLRFTIWKQKLSIWCYCGSHYVVNFHFFLWFLLVFFNYFFSFFIVFLWFIFRLPFFFFTILIIFCILLLCFILWNYFQSCVFNTWNISIFLTLQDLFELAWKVIEIKIFIVSLVSFHKIMTSIIHMFSHRFSRTKIMSVFVFASDTHKANFNFLLEIFNQSLFAVTIVLFRDKKAMGRLHMSQIFCEIRRLKFTENTNIFIFLKRLNFSFFLLFFFTSDKIWVVFFSFDMLVESISWAKLFSLL